MPYVVSVAVPRLVAASREKCREKVVVSRAAVATIEDARNAVFVHNLTAVPEEGCVVTLPDQTQITIERIGWHEIDRDGALDESGQKEGGLFSWEVLACWNAEYGVDRSAFRRERNDG